MSLRSAAEKKKEEEEEEEEEVVFDEGAELEQVNVLYSLLEDRYRKKVCATTLSPVRHRCRSYPYHYSSTSLTPTSPILLSLRC